jgi:hypothetical protein
MFLHDPRIIRKQGEKKRSSRNMEAHTEEEEMEEDMEDIPAPGSRGYDMARKGLRGRSSCKSRVDAGVTPTNSTTNTAPWDDGIGDATTSPAPGQSHAHVSIDNGDRSSPETSNR